MRGSLSIIRPKGGDDRKALYYYTRAAEVASQKYANTEVVAHYMLAAEAAPRFGEPPAELRRRADVPDARMGAMPYTRNEPTMS
jgi:hypothetical protein